MSGYVGADPDAVVLYGAGLVCCSVCVPEGMPLDEVERRVNAQNPTGIDSPWRISGDEAFATGEPHPCPCEQTPGRVHRLLSC